eukprot:COSAG02_NODE_1122_length_14450_cov_4.124173_1_plen_622_part_00
MGGMVPSGEESGEEQLEERAPMMVEGGEALLPGQPPQDVEEDSVGGQVVAIVHVQSELDSTTTRARTPRGSTSTTEESVATAPDPMAVEAPKERSDDWDGWQDDLCAVCQAPCSDTPLKCGHALHPQCLAEWTLSNAEQRGNCPTCRQPLNSRPRSPPDRNLATTPRIPTPPGFDLTDDEQTPDPATGEIAMESRVNWRDVGRYALRLSALGALVTISGLTIFTCTFSDDACCTVECEGGLAARYRYSNDTCVCADTLSTGWPQPSPRCERPRYPGQRLVRAADSDARCAAFSLSNRLVESNGALKGSNRYLILTSIGATCATVGLRSLNSTLECESVLRAANNNYADDTGLVGALTQVRRGLAENTFRYLYHVEGGQMFNREDAAPGTRRTGWYRKRTPSYSATDCGAATFIEASPGESLFRMNAYEGDIRANPDNPRYAPTVEWVGFDGPHPVDRGVGLPVDISSGWEFVPPVLNVDHALEEPYARTLEAATLQNEAFAQGHVAGVFCVAPDDLQDAPVGGICAQEPLSYLDMFYWFLLLPMLVVGAGVLQRLKKNQLVGRVLLVLLYWLVYLWVAAAQCSHGRTTMMNAEFALGLLLIVSLTCVCMCRMPCCSNERLQ